MIRRTLGLLLCSLAIAPAAHAVALREGTVNFREGTRGTSLPIRAGSLDKGEGFLRVKGKLALGRGENRVVLRALDIDLRRGGVVTALVDGLRQLVFEVDSAGALVGDNPKRIRVRRVRLSTAGALAGLDRELRLAVAATPRFLTLVGGQSVLTFDASFESALAEAQVTPGANEGAVITDSGAAQFPISRGRLFLDRRGPSRIDHGGGLTFSKDAAVALRFTDFLFDVRASVFRGRVDESSQRAALLAAELGRIAFESNSATSAEAPVTLTAQGADALNTALGTAFAEGAAIGTVAVSAVLD